MKLYFLHICLIINFLFVYGYSYSQQDTSVSGGPTVTVSKSTEEKSQESELDSLLLNILHREFTKIITGSDGNLGTYAQIDTKNEHIALSGSIPLSRTSNFNLTAKGSPNNGLLSLFQTDAAGANISLGTQFNLGLFGQKDSIKYDATKYYNFIYFEDSLQQLKITLANEDSMLYKKFQLDSLQKEEKIQLISQQIKKIRNPDTVSASTPMRDTIKVDSLTLILNSLKLELKQIKSDVFTGRERHLSLRKNNRNAMISRLSNSKVNSIQLRDYTIDWFSVFANFDNRTFKLFNSESDFNLQLQNRSFNKFEFGIKYSKYKFGRKAFQTHYTIGSLSYLLDDNFDNLDKLNLNDEAIYFEGNLTRKVTSSQTAYTGNYTKGISKFRFKLDYYLFISKNKNIALHTSPDFIIAESMRGRVDFLFGLFLAALNKSDKSIVNTELVVSFPDIFKKKEMENEQKIESSFIGLQVTIPISILNLVNYESR